MSKDFLDKLPYLKADDIANGVKYIITQPSNVNVSINDLQLKIVEY